MRKVFFAWGPQTVRPIPKSSALVIGALGFAYMLGQWIIEGSLFGLTLKVLGIVIGVIALIVVTRWRSGIYLSLTWLVIEDLPRKYLGNNMLIYFAKDALIALLYLAFLVALIKRHVRIFRPPFWLPLLAFVGLGLAQVFNPNSTSIFYGLLGLKLYFYYIPLMFLGYSLIHSDQELKKFLSSNLALGVIVALVGIIQALGWTDFLNPEGLAPELQALGHLARESPFTHRAITAPPSVFVSAGRFDFYLILIFILGLGIAGSRLLQSRRGGKLVFLALGIIGVAALLSGSRAAILYSLASAFILMFAMVSGYAPGQGGRVLLVKAIRRSLMAVGLCILAMVLIFPEAVGASWSFYYETLSPQNPRSELYYRAANYPLQNFLQIFQYADWPIGYGTGAGSLGAQYVSRVLGRPAAPVTIIENGYGTLILELGVLGPFLWILWSGALVISGWRAVRRLQGTQFYSVGIAILWFAFLLLFPLTYYGIQPYQNYILNAYFWLLMGVLFRLPELAIKRGIVTSLPSSPANGRLATGMMGRP